MILNDFQITEWLLTPRWDKVSTALSLVETCHVTSIPTFYWSMRGQYQLTGWIYEKESLMKGNTEDVVCINRIDNCSLLTTINYDNSKSILIK